MNSYPSKQIRFCRYPVGWNVVHTLTGRHGQIHDVLYPHSRGKGTRYQITWRPTAAAPATVSLHPAAELRSATAREVAALNR